jgi:hypothetical protein
MMNFGGDNKKKTEYEKDISKKKALFSFIKFAFASAFLYFLPFFNFSLFTEKPEYSNN